MTNRPMMEGVLHPAIRPVTLLLAAIIAAVLVGCGSSQTASSSHHGSRPSPSVIPSALTPTTAPTPRAPAASSPPPPSASAGSPGIPHAAQQLVFSGYVSGTVTSAEVKECGSGSNLWAIELSNIVLGPSQVSLTLLVQGYSAPGAYQASGAVDVIEQQTLQTFPEVRGQIEISDAMSGVFDNVTFQSSAGQSITVNGSWTCAG